MGKERIDAGKKNQQQKPLSDFRNIWEECSVRLESKDSTK